MKTKVPVIVMTDMARPPATAGGPDSPVEQVESIFHELHADGRNALCGVCDGQYRY